MGSHESSPWRGGFWESAEVLKDRHDDARITARAMKQLSKSHLTRSNINYEKEIIALTKFSRARVSCARLTQPEASLIVWQFTKYFVEFFGWFEKEESIFIVMEYIPLKCLDSFTLEGLRRV